MGDLSVGEGFIDAVMIRVTATGAAALGLAPTCTLTRLSTGARVGLTVAEVSDGIYKVTDMAPAADDEYLTEWAVAGANTIYQAFKLFKVGGGVIADWENGGRLDLLLDGIIADIGVFPSANYATLADYVEDIRTRLIAILADVTGLAGAAMRGTDGAALVASGWDAALATILDNFSALRIGYLDQLDFALQEAIAALQTDLDNPNQYKADLTTLETRLSAARAGYLDQLDFNLQEAIAAIQADIGVFPTANYATLAAYVEDIRTRLIAIVADTGAIAWGDITGIVNDIGVFPTANYVTLAAYVEDIRARMVVILADVTGIAGAAMRGTDGAALVASGWDAGLATILDTFTALRIGYLDELDFDLQGYLDSLDTLIDGIIADIGVFPSANYATLAAYVEDIRTRLIAIVGDTNELQISLADGGFTDLLIDAIIERTSNLPDDPADASDIAAAHALLATEAKQDIIDGLIDGLVADMGVFPTANYATLAAYVEDVRTRLIAIVGDTNELQISLADGGFTNLLIDSIIERTSNLPDDPADASVVAAAHALLATEAKQDIIDTNVDNLGTDVEEAHERAFLRRYPFVTTNESVSNAAEVSLAAPAVVTPTFPTGATRLNSYVVAILKANNQTAAEHNIGVTLQKNIAAGGWVDVRDFTASPPLTLPAVDATGDSVTLIEPVSITTGQSVQFRFQVDSDNAGEVHYTQVFFFALEYDFQ